MRPGVLRAAVVGILLLGAALRTVQYAAFSSLYMDEIALVLGIVERGWSDLLLRPLDYAQVAPLGFLLLVKASVTLAGNTEAGLRFLPYLLSLASLVLFWLVARRFLEPLTMLAALTLFALSPTLTLYAGMMKQYSGDVAVTLLLVWMTLRVLEDSGSMARAVIVGVAGGLAILLSHPAVLVAAGLGILLLVRSRGGIPVGRVLVIGAGWALGAALVTWHSLATLSPDTNEYMQEFWKAGFVPRPWLGAAELLWIPNRTGTLLAFFATGLEPPYPTILERGIVAALTLLLPLGFWRIARNDAWAASTLAIPFVVAIAVSAARLLPFGARVSLFTGSFLLLVSVAGVETIRGWLPLRPGTAVHRIAVGCLVLLAVASVVREPPPAALGGTLPVLRAVKERATPADRFAVAGGPWAFRLVEYYGERLELEHWVRLEPSPSDTTSEQVLRAYLRRIDALRGAPAVWVHLEGTRVCEEEAILGYLDAIGRRRDSLQNHLPWGHRISAHRYDLSDPDRLAAASAATYPLPACELYGMPASAGRGSGSAGR